MAQTEGMTGEGDAGLEHDIYAARQIIGALKNEHSLKSTEGHLAVLRGIRLGRRLASDGSERTRGYREGIEAAAEKAAFSRRYFLDGYAAANGMPPARAVYIAEALLDLEKAIRSLKDQTPDPEQK